MRMALCASYHSTTCHICPVFHCKVIHVCIQTFSPRHPGLSTKLQKRCQANSELTDTHRSVSIANPVNNKVKVKVNNKVSFFQKSVPGKKKIKYLPQSISLLENDTVVSHYRTQLLIKGWEYQFVTSPVSFYNRSTASCAQSDNTGQIFTAQVAVGVEMKY